MTNQFKSSFTHRDDILKGIKAPLLAFLFAFAVLLMLSQLSQKSLLTPETVSPEDYESEDYETADLSPTTPPANTPVSPKVTKAPEPTWLEYRIRKNDTMEKILRAVHAKDDIRQLLLTQKLKTHRRLRPNQSVYFRLDDNGNLSSLLYKTSLSLYLNAGYDSVSEQPWAKEEPPKLKTHQRRVGGKIDTSLFAAADVAGMSDAAINELIESLETQINFYRDVRQGDTFRVIYEEFEDEYGERVGGNINVLAFEYISHRTAKPRTIRGVRNDADTNYYAPDGKSLQGAFLPAPLKYRRISSKFSLSRYHPILKKWRSHRGVDYAAPSGIPVRSTADGVVTKVARERGYGKVVFVQHFNIYTTVYAHLRSFAKGIKRGSRIKQGQRVGYVGQTGLATGPHLHYELRVNGKHKNPLSVNLPRQLPPLKEEKLAAFQQISTPLLAKLDTILLP